MMYVLRSYIMSRPYLILPKLITQPTWGGEYIVNLKNLNKGEGGLNKIGQSYELSSSSILLTDVDNSNDIKNCLNSKGNKTIRVSSIEKTKLLIKLNHAFGNSFQIHIKQGTKNTKWEPKPEMWYFLENGYVSIGLKQGADLNKYKSTCIEIDNYMKKMSAKILCEEISVDEARKKAREFVENKNPWQFVNRHVVNKYDIIDLSSGGTHHSWEDDKNINPGGNVIFEVQIESKDNASTIRAFDQGKIQQNGVIRELQIEDYFAHIDTSPDANNITNLKRKSINGDLLKNKYYVLDAKIISNKTVLDNCGVYNHIYVRDGQISVEGGDFSVNIKKGHSCFIPSSLHKFTMWPIEKNSTVLITRPN